MPKKDKRGGAREGAGRPRLMQKPTMLTFWVDKRQHRKLSTLADRAGISVSEVLRRIIDALDFPQK